jgi:uncharacterized protein
VMLVAAVTMFRGGAGGSAALEAESAPALTPMLSVAVGVGALTGIIGIGGGFLIVPALVLLARVPMKQAVGTSLLVIAMNSASGFAGYAGRVVVPWGFVAAFTGIAILGILAGTALVRFVSQAQLKRSFAVFLIAVGLFTLYQNRAVLRRVEPAPAEAATPARR